jgi:hypothetical protein
MEIQEYLLSYGSLGDFGRFRPLRPLTCRRGERAVVRSYRGLELASVLCPARPGHAQFLPNTSVGQLLRLATAADEQTAAQMEVRARHLFGEAHDLAAELTLPLQILDVEVLLDGQHTIVHLVRSADCDVRAFVSGLSRRHDLHVILQDLTRPATTAGAEPEEEHGCGLPGCGRTAGGGCSRCGSGKSCSTCGSVSGQDLQGYFAEARLRMEQQRRLALL